MIPLSDCNAVYIGETGKAMPERIKEHKIDVRLACTGTFAVSEHAKKTNHCPG